MKNTFFISFFTAACLSPVKKAAKLENKNNEGTCYN